MNEYNPSPKRPIPLGYAGKGIGGRPRRPSNFSSVQFGLGCLGSFGVLILAAWILFLQIPFLDFNGRAPQGPSYSTVWGGYILGIAVDLAMCVIAYYVGKRSLAMGFLFGLLIPGCLTGLIFTTCMSH